MTPAIEEVILKSPIESKIWGAARKQGTMTMKEDAMVKAFAGMIPFAEVNALSSLLIEDEATAEAKEAAAKLTEAAPVLMEDEEAPKEKGFVPFAKSDVKPDNDEHL